MKHGILASLLALVFIVPARASTFCVNNKTGNDKHSGQCPFSPFKTIRRATQAAAPGDTVEIMAGLGEYNEQVILSRSGSKGLPITFTRYPGDRAVLDGNSTLQNGFTNQGNPLKYIVIDHLEIRNYVFAGVDCEGDCENITIRNSEIHQNGLIGLPGSGGFGINISGYSHPRVPSKNITIENNTVNGNAPRNVDSGTAIGVFMVDTATIANNVADNNNGNGILVEICDNVVVSNNVARYNVSDEGGSGTAGIWASGGHTITIENNWLEGNVWAGIEINNESQQFVDGAPYDYHVFNNALIKNWFGIMMDGMGLDKNHRNNEIYNNTIVDSTFTGVWVENNSPMQDSFTGFFNNLSAQLSTGRPALLVDSGFSFRNPNTLQLDYDFYFEQGSSVPVNWMNKLLSFTKYQSVSHWDAHGVPPAAPQFANSEAEDYHLLAGSPGVDAGDTDFLPVTDYDGHPRPDGPGVDVGGFESPGPCRGSACTPGRINHWTYDSSVQAVDPVSVTLPPGINSVSRRISVTVTNQDADKNPHPLGHRVQLTALDGTCPAGTVSGLPVFTLTSLPSGAQDTVFLDTYTDAKKFIFESSSGLVPLTITRRAFRNVSHCTLQFEVANPLAGNVDPSPADDRVSVELNVTVLDGADR